MSTFRYNLRVSEVHLNQKALLEEVKGFDDKELVVKIKGLVGMQISILLEEPADFPNQGTFFAKNKAEDKASEIIAAMLGTTFGGTQKHLANYIEEEPLKGKFVRCEVVSIEQVEA